MTINTEIFGLYTADGTGVELFHNSGEVVTRLDANVYPLSSDKSARYEHPRGITLNPADAQKLGIVIEST